MDGRQFDSLTRSLAESTSRRKFLGRGAVLAGVATALTRLDSASAARRGQNGISSICRPDGAGGYYRDTVATIRLQAALNAGAIQSDCCAHAECGASTECANAYCDFGAGACAVSNLDGAACTRPGCANGVCSGGGCADPAPYLCAGDGVCNICTYDSCAHHCDCWIRPCSTDDHQCSSVYCSPAAGGCVSNPVNEGVACDTFGFEGICTTGYCSAA